jgi:hypothetical protein
MKGIFFLLVPLLLFSFTAWGEGMGEEAKIMKLIEAVGNLPEGTEFIRNGESHTRQEAADHLRSKYNRAKKRIKSAADFIEHIASKSSLSGKDYLIKLPGEEPVTANEFFKRELSGINSSE